MTEKKLNGETLYKKFGTRYKPVQFGWETYGWPPGFYLVHVDKSCTGTRRCIDVENVQVECVLREVEQAMMKEMQSAKFCSVTTADGKERTSKTMTPEELELIRKLVDSFGSDMVTFSYNSMHDVIRAGIEAFRKRVTIV